MRARRQANDLSTLISPMNGMSAIGRPPITTEQVQVLGRQINRMSQGRIALVENPALLRESGHAANFISPEGLLAISRQDPGWIARHGLQEYVNSGRGVLIIQREQATYSVVVHEVFHLEHWKRDPAIYNGLSRLERERHVFEQMRQQHIWRSLSESERRAQIDNMRYAISTSTLDSRAKQEMTRDLVEPALRDLSR